MNVTGGPMRVVEGARGPVHFTHRFCSRDDAVGVSDWVVEADARIHSKVEESDGWLVHAWLPHIRGMSAAEVGQIVGFLLGALGAWQVAAEGS